MNRFFCYSNYPSLTQQNHWGPSLSPELLTPRREGSRCSQSSSLAVPNMMWVSEEQGWGYTPPVNSQRCSFDQNQLRIWSESPSLPRTPCHIKKSIHCTDGLLKISFYMWPPLSRMKIFLICQPTKKVQVQTSITRSRRSEGNKNLPTYVFPIKSDHKLADECHRMPSGNTNHPLFVDNLSWAARPFVLFFFIFLIPPHPAFFFWKWFIIT